MQTIATSRTIRTDTFSKKFLQKIHLNSHLKTFSQNGTKRMLHLITNKLGIGDYKP